ncbi:MAG: MEKHLA domain-containing protein [Flavobacteriales bacterium]|nr:MEKHLA domain-containing protein [Flavobacteriales bacterium]
MDKKEQHRINELLSIIQLTEHVTTRIHGIYDKERIFSIISEELKRSKEHRLIIQLLDNDNKDLVVKVATFPDVQVKLIEQVVGKKVIGFTRAYSDMPVVHRAMEKRETYSFASMDFVSQLLPGKMAKMVAQVTGHSQKTSTASPIIVGDKVIGVLGIDSPNCPEFLKHYELTVKNLTHHVSVALQLANEHDQRRITEAKYLEFLENTPDAITGVDADGNVNAWNKGAERMFGYKHEEIHGKPYSLLVPTEKAGERNLILSETDKKGHVANYETIRVAKSGKQILVEMTMTKGRDSDGRVHFSAIIRDISERKEAEQLLKESETKFRDIFEKSGDAILIIENGKFVDCNRSAVGMLDYEVAADFMGRHPSEVSPPTQPDGRGSHEKADEMMRLALQNGTHRFEWEHTKQGGQVLPVEVLLTAIRNKPEDQLIHCVWRDISERKISEQGLLIRDRAFDSTDQGIVITDPRKKDNPIIFANRAFLLMTGYSEAEVMGKNCRLLQGAQSDPATVQAIRDAVKNGADYRCEVLNYRKDGTTFWNELVITGIRNEAGILVNYIGRQNDITKRKRARKKLMDSELMLLQSQKMAGIGSYALDISSGMWTSSPLLDDIFGITNDYIRNVEGWRALVHPDDREMMREYLATHVLKNHQPFNKEYRIIRVKDGKEVWVDGRGDLEFDGDGNPTRMIGTIQDITERKQQIQELKKLSAAVEQSPASVVMTDLKGNITYVNPRFEEVTGFAAKKVIGKNPRILKSGHTSKEEYTELWKTITAGKVWTGEFHNRKRDGTLYWEKASIGPIFNDKGEITEFLAVKEDITQIKEAQKALNETLLHLEDKVEERTHELQLAKESLQRTNDDFMSSLQYAQRIQEASLPSDVAFKKVFDEHFVIYRPKDIVSGDFYWLYQKGQEIVVAMGDCTGHGVPGALMAMAGLEQLGNIVIKGKITRPDLVLEELDQAMGRLLKQKDARFLMNDGMDISVVRIDRANGVFEYAGAQSHGLVIKKDRVIELVPDRASIGGLVRAGFKDFSFQRFEFETGDKCFLFSDGIYDQFGGPKGKKMLRKHFTQLLLDTSTQSVKLQGKAIGQHFKDWLGKGVQIDDVTVVGFKL